MADSPFQPQPWTSSDRAREGLNVLGNTMRAEAEERTVDPAIAHNLIAESVKPFTLQRYGREAKEF